MRATLKGNEIVTKVRSCSFGGGTKGNCFSISVPSSVIEEKANCFSLSTYDKPCFSIKCEEEYDELRELDPNVDLSTLGFTAIKCIASHGLNEFIVIGRYKETQFAIEEDVMAKIQYMPSTSGGVGEIKSIGYKETLADISLFLPEGDKILYDDIVYLDCYDTTTSISNLAIVTGSHVYWVEPILFVLMNTSIGRANEAEALKHPFFLEETYGVSTWSEAVTASCSSVPKYHIVADCASGGPFDTWSWVVCDNGCEHGIDSTYPPATLSGNANRSLSYNITDGLDNQTNIAQGLLDSYPGIYGGTVPNIYSTPGVSALRGNVALIGNRFYGNEVAKDSFKYTEGCHTEDYGFGDGSGDGSCASYGSTGEYFRRIRHLYYGTFFDKVKYDALYTLPFTPIDSRGLCSDNVYMAMYGNGGIQYSKVDGTKNGTHAGANFTLIKGVLLTVDGTATINQTVLDDEV